MQNVEWYFYIMLTIWIVLLLLPDRDFIAPEFVFCSSMVLCSGLYIYMQEYWNRDFHQITFILLLTSSIEFIVIGLACRYFSKCIDNIQRVQIMPIDLSDFVALLATLISIITVVLGINTIITNGGIMEYRNMRVSNEVKGLFLVNQLAKLLSAYIFIALYSLMYNKIIHNKPLLNKKIQIASILFSIVAIVIVSLGRKTIIDIFLFAIFIHIILKTKMSKRGKIPWKIVLGVVLVIPFFYYSSELVGRDFDRISNVSPLFYLGQYLGCGLNFFNSNIIYMPNTTQYFGQSSFASIYSKVLIGTFLPEYTEDYLYHEFNLVYGNSVTLFGRWYEDWGVLGVYIMTAVTAYCFSYFYHYYVKKSNDSPNFCHIMYANLIPILVFAGYDDSLVFALSFGKFTHLMLLFVLLKYLKSRNRIRITV